MNNKDIQVLTHIQDKRLVLKSFTKTEVSNKYRTFVGRDTIQDDRTSDHSYLPFTDAIL